MTAPYYLQAPSGDEYKPSFLDKVGNGIGKAWDATPPEAFFALAQAMVRPGPFIRNLTEGITGLGQQLQAKNKKRGLASALDSLKGGMSPEQQQVLSLLDPEQALPLLAQNAFAKPNEPTSDIQNYQFAVGQGFKGSYFDFKKQLALAGAGDQGIVDVPGLGPIDKNGNRVGGQPTPPPQAMPTPQPSPPPQAKPTVNPAPFGMAPGDGGAMVGGMPPMESAPQTASAPQAPPLQKGLAGTPVLDSVAKRLNLPAPPQGQKYIYGPDGITPTLTSVPGLKPTSTALPPEVGARVGLANSFLKRYDQIAGRISKLETVKGRAQLVANTGEGAEIRRQIEGGAEALVRTLTGAGKSQEEATSYTSRYIPGPLDTTFDLNSKLKGLRYDLEGAVSGIMADHGGWQSPAKDYFPEPPQGAINYLRLNPKLKDDFEKKYGPGSAAQYIVRQK